MWSPADSAISVTPEIQKALENASADEMKDILAQAAVDQGLVVRDYYSPQVLIPLAGAERLEKTINVNGKAYVISGTDALSLANAEAALFERLFRPDPNATRQQPVATTTTTEQPRNPNTGRFASQDEADQAEIVRQSELELKFKRGEISTDEYLQQSGAIERHLESQGVSMEGLVEASNKGLERSWEQASSEFLNSAAGADWPGGAENMKALGDVLVQMNAADQPSAENISRAYRYLRESNQLRPNEAAELERRIAGATSSSELANLLNINERAALRQQQSSGLFGR